MAILAAQPESGFSSDFLRDYEAAQQRVKQVKSAEPLIISELMAANDGSLRDADGDASDWIEIYNAGTNTVTLTGWRLTADPANLGQWIFPSTDLGPDRFLLVFASGKNRAIAGRELHTSFRLDAAGRYLALVEPDGQTIAYQFAPAYPAQVQGVFLRRRDQYHQPAFRCERGRRPVDRSDGPRRHAGRVDCYGF